MIIGSKLIVCADNVETVEIHFRESVGGKCKERGKIDCPIVSTKPQEMRHVLDNKLTKMVESCFLCFETCLQVLNSQTIIF